MNHNIVSAVFDTRQHAETAIHSLRQAGIDDSSISVIARNEGSDVIADGAGTVAADEANKEEHAKNFLTGMLGGGAVGAVAGLAALAIPGVGPFIAAGAFAQAALTGAVVGATAGSVMGYMAENGIDKEDAEFYSSRLDTGGTFVSVDTSKTTVSPDSVLDILTSNGGLRRIV